jgi:hypothetical protein
MANRIVQIDFNERKQIYDQVSRIAEIEVRTVEQQIVYFIQRGLKEWIGFNPNEMGS